MKEIKICHLVMAAGFIWLMVITANILRIDTVVVRDGSVAQETPAKKVGFELMEV